MHETELSCKVATNLSFFPDISQVFNCLGERKKFHILFQTDHSLNHIWPEYGQAGTINFAFLWFQADHRLDHICPEYGQPGTINLYGPEYDQPGIIL